MVVVKIFVLCEVPKRLPKSDICDNVEGVVLRDFAEVDNTRMISGIKVALNILYEGMYSVCDLLFELLVLLSAVLIGVRLGLCKDDYTRPTAGAMVALNRSWT